MEILMVALGALSLAGIVATVRSTVRDGYRRIPTGECRSGDELTPG